MSTSLTVTQAARLLGISRQAVLSLIARNHLRARLVGGGDGLRGMYLIPRREVERRSVCRSQQQLASALPRRPSGAP